MRNRRRAWGRQTAQAEAAVDLFLRGHGYKL
jgi:hypothetical protein